MLQAIGNNTVEPSTIVPALAKLVDYVASGVGSIAGPMIATWRAKKEAEAKLIAAQGDAAVLKIHAEAQSEAREILTSDATKKLDITHLIGQRIQFQEQKRQINIESVVKEAAYQLDGKTVADHDPDHDWTARFFNEVQDVSSVKMQALWAKVLAGEVERAGSTSAKTLGILKNLDQKTALQFGRLCSACMYLSHDGKKIDDARVPTLGGNAGSNCLREYGLAFNVLNILNEHGLIISDYNSWMDYRNAIGVIIGNTSQVIRVPFIFQSRNWALIPESQNDLNKKFKLHGVALTESGKELSRVVDLETMDKFTQALTGFFQGNNLKMTEVDDLDPKIFNDVA